MSTPDSRDGPPLLPVEYISIVVILKQGGRLLFLFCLPRMRRLSVDVDVVAILKFVDR